MNAFSRRPRGAVFDYQIAPPRMGERLSQLRRWSDDYLLFDWVSYTLLLILLPLSAFLA